MKKQDLIDSAPLILIVVAIFYTLITISTTDTIISTKHYIGFIFVGISIVLFFIQRKYSEIATGIITLAGIFGLVAFLPSIFSLSIAGIKFQIFPLFVFIILVIITYYKYKNDFS